MSFLYNAIKGYIAEGKIISEPLEDFLSGVSAHIIKVYPTLCSLFYMTKKQNVDTITIPVFVQYSRKENMHTNTQKKIFL